MPEKLLAASAMDLKRNDAKGSERDVEIRLLICCSVFALLFFYFSRGYSIQFLDSSIKFIDPSIACAS